MTTVFLLCGAPGCGKSSWAKHQMMMAQMPNRCVRISRDDIRFSMIHGDEEYFSKEKEVFAEFIRQIQNAIDKHMDQIYVDATHLNRYSRAKTLRNLRLDGVQLIAVDFQYSLETCLARNARREGLALVPEDVLRSMYNVYEAPQFTEGKFNFHRIIHISEERNEN